MTSPFDWPSVAARRVRLERQADRVKGKLQVFPGFPAVARTCAVGVTLHCSRDVAPHGTASHVSSAGTNEEDENGSGSLSPGVPAQDAFS